MDFPLNKPQGKNGQEEPPTEAGDNGIEKLGCRSREFEEIMAHFTLDLQKNSPMIT